MCPTSSSPSSSSAWSDCCSSRPWWPWPKPSPTPTRSIEMATKFIEVRDAEMRFDTKKGSFHALARINLTVEQGEFLTLIGHSGCGKSTLLNLLAGLTRATSGALICAGREIDGPSPERAVVFQNHSLLPWLTCFENVYLAVERVFAATEPVGRLKERTGAALALVGLSAAASKRPNEISGGMKQRLRIVAQTGSTVVMVTHDVDEAVLLSDRIVMMTNGPAATIGDIVQVRLPRPRDRVSLAHDALYNDYRTSVLEFLYRRHAKAA